MTRPSIDDKYLAYDVVLKVWANMPLMPVNIVFKIISGCCKKKNNIKPNWPID